MKYRIIFGVIVFLAGCKEKADTSKSVPSPAKNESVSATHTFSAPDSFKAGLGKVYGGYIQVQEALAADDFQKAKQAFSSMHGILHMIPEDNLDSTAKAEWDSSSVSFMRVLHPMAASKDIAEMRDHLKDFTPLLSTAIEKLGIGGTVPVYLYHCPMAFGGNGADWLQKVKIKANPYQGKAMPDCGDLVREIKP